MWREGIWLCHATITVHARLDAAYRSIDNNHVYVTSCDSRQKASDTLYEATLTVKFQAYDSTDADHLATLMGSRLDDLTPHSTEVTVARVQVADLDIGIPVGSSIAATIGKGESIGNDSISAPFAPIADESITRCGGCGRGVDPTIERCPGCGFPDGSTMTRKGWRWHHG